MHKFIDNIVAFSLKNKLFIFFCTGFMAISMGIVINFSTSSALRPAH